MALFELSPVIAKEASPRNIVETLLNSITNLKTGKPLTPEEVKKKRHSLLSCTCASEYTRNKPQGARKNTGRIEP